MSLNITNHDLRRLRHPEGKKQAHNTKKKKDMIPQLKGYRFAQP